MKENIRFYEVQRFQWWLWVPLIVFIVILFYNLFRYWKETGSLNNFGIYFPILIMALVLALFVFSKMETKIDQTGVYVKFTPFHFHYKGYSWEEISEIYIRKYHPIGEYGGWGIRWGASGKAYNVRGNKGLQVVTKKGKRLLIGTQRDEELSGLLKEFNMISDIH